VLVLLNGPPASGKSTLSARLVGRRPLALHLDIDVVRGLLGDWLEQPTDAGLAARALAIAMARTHLDAGHDVFVPQFLARVDFIDELAQLAQATGATFVEIALVLTRDGARTAFAERTAAADDQTHRDAAALVERSGGVDAIDEMYDRYASLLAHRPGAHRISVVRGDIESAVSDAEDILRTSG
jgi:predicted kinase